MKTIKIPNARIEDLDIEKIAKENGIETVIMTSQLDDRVEIMGV